MNSSAPNPSANQRQRFHRRVGTVLLVVMLASTAARPTHAQQGTFDGAARDQIGHVKAAGWRGPAMHEALQRLYSQANARPLWTRAGRPTPQARQIVEFIANSSSRGLDPSDYGAQRLLSILSTLDATAETDSERLAVIDVELSRALLALLSDLGTGRIDPASLRVDIHVNRGDRDFAAAVADVSRAEDVPGTIAAVEPPYVGYTALLGALARYRVLTSDTTLMLPRPERTVRPNDSYRDAPRLRRLLLALGDLASTSAFSTDTVHYVGSLVLGVMDFQRRHGLEADGVLGPQTIEELRLPLTERVRQIELSLERWRWLPHRAPERYIVVNIPAFRLYAFEHDSTAARPVLSMNVVVGEAENRHDTPVFVGEMRELVFRPYWDVPLRIARKELVPAIKRGAIDMESEGYEIVGTGDNPSILPATRANLDAVAAGTLRLRQRPGGVNALGLVKFVFPNAHDVYLHGTPAMQLFRYARRDFSHGCIRAEQPVDLAVFALCTDSSWTRQSIEAAMHGTQTVRVPLAKSVMVYVLYFSVAVGPDGTVHFYPDLYDQDLALDRALEAR